MSNKQSDIYQRPVNSTPTAATDLVARIKRLVIELAVCVFLFEGFWWYLHEAARNEVYGTLPTLQQKILFRLLWWRDVVRDVSSLVLLLVLTVFTLGMISCVLHLGYRVIGLIPAEPPEPVVPPRPEGD